MPNSTPDQPTDPRMVFMMLWGAFLVSTVMYIFVIMTAVEQPQPLTFDNIVKTLTTNGTSIGIGLMTIGVIVGSVVLSRKPLTSTPKDLSPFLIRCAIAQTPAIFGMIIALSTSQTAFVWVGSGITALLLLLNRPSTRASI